jgi:Zn-dependent membrane protease YugP
MIFLGLFLRITGLLWAGILLFGVMVVFMLLTLPVEIDASRRGLNLLRQSGLLVAEQDTSGARTVLTAAALTYVAAAISAVLQLFYFIGLANNRR